MDGSGFDHPIHHSDHLALLSTLFSEQVLDGSAFAQGYLQGQPKNSGSNQLYAKCCPSDLLMFQPLLLPLPRLENENENITWKQESSGELECLPCSSSWVLKPGP